jgi:UDP-N-acetylglucosamine acyltransferase
MSLDHTANAHIHPSAIIHPRAILGHSVKIGPYTIIGEQVKVGDNCVIGSHVRIEGCTDIGDRNEIHHGAVIGQTPQDVKYSGEPSYLVIGSDNRIFEYTTISGGTASGGGTTVIGSRNVIMSYVYIAHDVRIKDEVIIANGVQVAGHVFIDACAVIGGQTGIHQHTKIGLLSMIGGQSRVTQDILPYSLAAGDPLKLYGANTIGLKRKGINLKDRNILRKVFRILNRSGLNVTNAKKQIMDEYSGHEMVENLVHFLNQSERGINRRRA